MVPQYSDFVVADGKWWYSSCLFNGLFCQSMENGHIEFMGLFPDEDLYQGNLYRRVILINRELFFIPFQARHISIYHLDYMRFEIFDVPDMEKMGKYVSAEHIENRLYLFPAYAPKALYFDLYERKLAELREFNEKISKFSENNIQKFYMAGTVKSGNYIYLLLKDTNRLIRYGYKQEKDIVSIYSPVSEDEKLGAIAASGRGFYISMSGKEQILYWEPDGEEERISYHIPCEREPDSIETFPIIKTYRNDVFLHFLGQNVCYKAALPSMEMEAIMLAKEKNAVDLMKQEGQELFFLPHKGSFMRRYSIEENKVYTIEADWKDAERDRLHRILERELSTVSESQDVSLALYLDAIKYLEENAPGEKQCFKTGSKIWKDTKVWN